MIKRLPKTKEQKTLGPRSGAEGTHQGYCRSCGMPNNCISNDNGYCQDCD